MKKILNINYESQNSQYVPDMWKNNACGIAVIKMIISFLQKTLPPIDTLINQGVAIGGYTEDGWTHESLVRLLRNYGINAYPQEFRTISVEFNENGPVFNPSEFSEKLFESGIQKIIQKIDNKLPSIVSVNAGFNDNAHTHLVLITGYDDKGFFYHDPDSRNGVTKKDEFVDLEKFKEYWRKFAIFVD